MCRYVLVSCHRSQYSREGRSVQRWQQNWGSGTIRTKPDQKLTCDWWNNLPALSLSENLFMWYRRQCFGPSRWCAFTKKNKWHAYRLLVACSTSFFPRFGVPSADICCLQNHLLSWLDECSSKPNRFNWAWFVILTFTVPAVIWGLCMGCHTWGIGYILDMQHSRPFIRLGSFILLPLPLCVPLPYLLFIEITFFCNKNHYGILSISSWPAKALKKGLQLLRNSPLHYNAYVWYV